MARTPKTAAAAAAGSPDSNYPVIRDKIAIQHVADYATKLAEVKKLEAEMKLHKVAILAAMAGAPEAVFGLHVVSQTEVAPLPATQNRIIDKTMIGQIIKGAKGRAGYTQIRVQ